MPHIRKPPPRTPIYSLHGPEQFKEPPKARFLRVQVNPKITFHGRTAHLGPWPPPRRLLSTEASSLPPQGCAESLSGFVGFVGSGESRGFGLQGIAGLRNAVVVLQRHRKQEALAPSFLACLLVVSLAFAWTPLEREKPQRTLSLSLSLLSLALSLSPLSLSESLTLTGVVRLPSRDMKLKAFS